jgi:type VI secretion system protein ImpH
MEHPPDNPDALPEFAPGSPLETLLRHPYRFDFFQAVRLLSWAAGQEVSSLTGRLQRPVGEDWQPQEEFVRFRSSIDNTFSSSQIASLRRFHEPAALSGQLPVPEMTVTFMGLAGAGGVLPGHYTQLVIDRTRAKDVALREFLDLFNHRLVSHFYRAWSKCHFYVGYETARRNSKSGEDLFTRALYCLIGQGTEGLRGRQEIDDETFLYYAGHFAHLPRSAISLQQLVFDYFNMPVRIQQFQGQWLFLRSSDQTRLGSDPSRPDNNQLGQTAIAGERIWGIENKFRIRLGPLSLSTFCTCLPGSSAFRPLGQLVRSYVGPALDFDVQLVLKRDEIPPCVISQTGTTRLGWNSWLFASTASADVDDAVFELDGLPNR